MNRAGAGGGGGVVMTAKWLLAALLTVSLVSTLLFGDIVTWLWSRTHVNTNKFDVPSQLNPDVHVEQPHITATPTIVEYLPGTSTTVGHHVTTMSSSDVTSLGLLYQKLMQAEQGSLVAADVSVVGTPSAVKHHMTLIQAAFQKLKVKVTHQAEIGAETKAGKIVLCLNTTSSFDNCVVSDTQLLHSKVNIIPELLSVIMSREFVCVQADSQRQRPEAVKGEGRWYGGQLSCYSSRLPDNMDDSCQTCWGWWLVANLTLGATGQFIPCHLIRSLNSSQRSGDSILVTLPRDLLTLDGLAPLVWQTEVLVTSWSPARLYLHPAGIAWTTMHELVHRKNPKNTSLLDLEQLFTELSDKNAAKVALTRLQSVLQGVVTSMAHHISSAAPTIRFCENCFQQLEILLVFDSSFQPIVLQVGPRKYTEHLSSVSDYILEQNILDDLAPMLVTWQSSSVDLLWPLYDLGIRYIKDDQVCDQKKVVCLGKRELIFLLNTRREQKASKNWIRLFPSTMSQCQVKHSSPHGGLQQELTGSTTFETLASIVEGYHLCPLHIDQKFHLSAPLYQHDAGVLPSAALTDQKPLHLLSYPPPPHYPTSAGAQLQACDSDNNSWPYLSAIHTYPYIQLHPEFSPLTTDYRAEVSYQITVVHIAGVSRHCQAEVRLEDQRANNRWANFILGLGDNTANILISSVDQPEATIHNMYRITIHRKQAGLSCGFDEYKGDYQVCSLQQDCSLPFSPTLTCGLQPVVGVQWTEFLQQHSALPQCDDDDSIVGEWRLPCFNCHNESSCFWAKAIWQPFGCQEAILGTDKVKDCLLGKRILFIGDSTNRGMLHYLLQRLNGSVFEWDKTHSVRVYPHLNNGKSIFAFAYYPQFWRRPGVRPGLDGALNQLLNRTSQWSHNETILVLGGVHWLAKHHFDILMETMKRDGASTWRVIVKGLGAGFHQPVHGVHQLSVIEQQQLFNHNQALLALARSLGFSVVDTFSLTMSRFRDFLHGKCACHFHQVSPVPTQVSQRLSSTGAEDQPRAAYHITGDINAVYSEMLINRMCIHRGG